MHHGAAAMHLVTAEGIFVDVDALSLLDYRRPGCKDLGLVTHHHRKVRHQYLDCTQARA
jgi:hypothetical protein